MLAGIAAVLTAPILLVLHGGEAWQEAVLCIVIGPLVFSFLWNQRADMAEAKWLANRRWSPSDTPGYPK